MQPIPHALPSQVASPFAGVGHGAHRLPQVSALVLVTQLVPQRCEPDGQFDWQTPELHLGAPPAGVGHTAHEGPQAVASSSGRHCPPHRLKVGRHVQTLLTQPSPVAHMPHESTEREFPQLSKAMRVPQFLFCR